MSIPDIESDLLDLLDIHRYRAPLLALYATLDEEIARLGPVCELSGRCCRFEEYGHTLFLSSVEAELLLVDAPTPSRPVDDGATCPWQDPLGRCSARGARPLGCRVYFCDPSYQPHAPELSERAISRQKALTESLGLPWLYAPLHHHLRQFAAQGRFPTHRAPIANSSSLADSELSEIQK